MAPFIIFIGIVAGLTTYMFANISKPEMPQDVVWLKTKPSPTPKKLSKEQKADLKKIDEMFKRE